MSAKHTPGPWECCDGPEGYQHRIYPVGTPEVICDVELTANARLIAAAPELLEALIAFQRAHDLADSESDRLLVGMQMGCAYEMARAAIAKATGAES